jgi:hypothetical protein
MVADHVVSANAEMSELACSKLSLCSRDIIERCLLRESILCEFVHVIYNAILVTNVNWCKFNKAK